MQFDWNQAQQLMGQQLLTQQLMGQIGPAMPYLVPSRDVAEDEPPPAYQAEIGEFIVTSLCKQKS